MINGVDSELYDWEDKLPRVEDLTNGMPPDLQKLMSSREVKKMKSTFCWVKPLSILHIGLWIAIDQGKQVFVCVLAVHGQP